MGFVISCKIVCFFGGDIFVDSELGMGSWFVVIVFFCGGLSFDEE